MNQNLELNMIPNPTIRIAKASQFDKGTRVFQFHLLNGAEEYEIPSGSTVRIRGKKPDGTFFEYDADSYDGSTVYVSTHDQMTILAGKYPAEIRILKDSDIIGSANFTICVEPSPMPNDAEVSETDLPIVEEALRKADELIEDMGEGVASYLNNHQADLEQMVDDYMGEHPEVANKVTDVQVDGTSVVSNKVANIPMASTSTKGAVIVDNALSASSTNPVQNKAITSVMNHINSVELDILGYLGYNVSEVVGVQIDYTNKTVTRLGAAANLTYGNDFNSFNAFNIRRCNLADDGTVNAYYGDSGYAEDGSNGQVMVEFPAFYYRIVPINLEKQSDGVGYHLRKANYYISDNPRPGFKLHPAFYNESNNPVDKIYLGASKACIYDTSAAAYLTKDEQVMDVNADLLSSIFNVKPASGLTQQFTRPNIEKMANNRGSGWHSHNIKAASMVQLLMTVEYAGNLQTLLGSGVTSIFDSPNTTNNSSYTGSTSSLGNTSGRATYTTNERDGTEYIYTAATQTSVSYRGLEDPYGNIWEWIYGVNIHGNGSTKGGIPYVCSDYEFAESKNTDNYVSAGFTLTNASGYVSAFGYSPTYDWLFMASETSGNSVFFPGDYHYIIANLNSYRIAGLGGGWNAGTSAGGFCWLLYYDVGYRRRGCGGRLLYVPQG